MASSPRIYQAERILRDTFDRYHAGAEIVMHDTKIIVPLEQKFHQLDEIQAYINECLTDPEVIEKFGNVPQVRVRARKGTAAAHYELTTSTIAIPLAANWASRELVILHELTHHIHHWQGTSNINSMPNRISHDQRFLEIYVELIGIRLGAQAKFLAWMIFIDANIWKPVNATNT